MSSTRNVPTFADYLQKHKDKTPDKHLFQSSPTQLFQTIIKDLTSEFRAIDVTSPQRLPEKTGAQASPIRGESQRQQPNEDDKTNSNKKLPEKAVSSRVQSPQVDCFGSYSILDKENNPNNAQHSQREMKNQNKTNLNQKSLLHEASPDLRQSNQDLKTQNFDFERSILADCNVNNLEFNRFKPQEKPKEKTVLPFQALEDTQNKETCQENVTKLQKATEAKNPEEYFESSMATSCGKALMNHLLQNTLASPRNTTNVGSNPELDDQYSKQIEKVLRQFMKSGEFQKLLKTEMENAVNNSKNSRLTNVETANTESKGINTTETKTLKSEAMTSQNLETRFSLHKCEGIATCSLPNSPAHLPKPLNRRASQAFIDLQTEKNDTEQSRKCFMTAPRESTKASSLSDIPSDSQSKPVYEIKLVISARDDEQKVALNDKSISIIVTPQLQDSSTSTRVEIPTTKVIQENSSSTSVLLSNATQGKKEESQPIINKNSKNGVQNIPQLSLTTCQPTKKVSNTQKTNPFDYKPKAKALNNTSKELNTSANGKRRTKSIYTLELWKDAGKKTSAVMQSKDEQKVNHTKQGTILSSINTTTQSTVTTEATKEAGNLKLQLKGYSRNRSLGSITHQCPELKSLVESLEGAQASSNNLSSQTPTPMGTQKFVNSLTGERATPSFAKAQNNSQIESSKKVSQSSTTKNVQGLISQRETCRPRGRSSSMATVDCSDIVQKIDLWSESQKQEYKAKLSDVISPEKPQSHTAAISSESYSKISNNPTLQNLLYSKSTNSSSQKLVNKPLAKLLSESKESMRDTYQERKKDWWKGVYSNLNNNCNLASK